MKALVIEPHGDDAILSCNSFLKLKDIDKDVITFSSRPSYELSKYYPVNNIQYMELDNLWYKDGKPILKTNIVHREFNEGLPIYDNYIETLRSEFEDFDKHVDEIYNKLSTIISTNSYDMLVGPVGLVHPYHVAVRVAINKLDTELPILYYVDKYYISNRYAKELYANYVKEYGGIEINPGYTKYEKEDEELINNFCAAYPTEKMLLRFYRETIGSIPCKYIYNNNKLDELAKELTYVN
jgi:hypothetical protein